MRVNWMTMTMGLGILLGVGCVSLPDEPEGAAIEPDVKSTDLCKVGKYHEAMRELPKEMAAWAEYTRRTGNTSEGAAGLLHYHTMSAVASMGDKDWGKILDDPKIPFEYKTDLIFEIVEARLGKGAIFSSYKTDMIYLPRTGVENSWDEVFKRLRKEIEAENSGSDK